MRAFAIMLLFGAVAAARADDPEPAVQTSPAATARATGASTGTPPRRVAASSAATAATARTPATARSKAMDQIDLGATQVTGNRELPNVMYVVPWKRPDLGEFAGRPPKSLLDEVLAPVDREVFRRQNRYFAALHPDAAAKPAVPASTPAAGAAPTLPAGDEK
ncbi:MAG: hypothetical protein KGL25_14110 [Gammaproteobacteria bacterium]|nr:hypothetical protein [Gammaproteobacteria bacterium]MDE2252529.1 hypothetical protein [Gammaproteobacteria bacterium]